jgi:hypothetical protein
LPISPRILLPRNGYSVPVMQHQTETLYLCTDKDIATVN